MNLIVNLYPETLTDEQVTLSEKIGYGVVTELNEEWKKKWAMKSCNIENSNSKWVCESIIEDFLLLKEEMHFQEIAFIVEDEDFISIANNMGCCCYAFRGNEILKHSDMESIIKFM